MNLKAFNGDFGNKNADVPKTSCEMWDEKYKGETLETIILPKSVETLFSNALKLNSFGNYVLHSGSPGTGKSTLAQAIPKMLGTQSKFYSCRSASEILDDIAGYAIYHSDKPRFVILDEADKALNPEKFYRDLQTLMDSTKKTLRFILTCNDVWRLPDPIISRCTAIDFALSAAGKTPEEFEAEVSEYKNRVFTHLKNIAVAETSAVEGTYSKSTIVKIIQLCYPDIRKMIGVMHDSFLQNGGSIIGEPPIITKENIETIFDYVITNKTRELYMYITGKISNCNGVYVPFFRYMIDRMPDKGMVQFGIISAMAMDSLRNVVDPAIMLYGYLCKVIDLVIKLNAAGCPVSNNVIE